MPAILEANKFEGNLGILSQNKKKKSEFPKAVCAAQPWAHFPFTCGVVGGVWGTETQAASDEKF